MTVADAVADWLAEKEIRHAFGIIGAGNIALWEAISRKGATEIVCCHHEQAAAIAASTYHRVCGQVSVAIVTTGAGSTNAITGVMAAYMDSTPLIVISGNEMDESLRGNTRVLGVQGYDSAAVAAHFTKFSTTRNSRVVHTLNNALTEALSKRQGPVWVNIPRDVQNAPV